jgi:microsomal dipeptidase-like Zn-dependent dipeptidase
MPCEWQSKNRRGGIAESSPSFAGWLRHVEHAIEVAGIDHVAGGSDFGFRGELLRIVTTWRICTMLGKAKLRNTPRFTGCDPEPIRVSVFSP